MPCQAGNDAVVDAVSLIAFASPRNPVDCTAHVLNEPALVSRFADAAVEDGGYASVLAFFTQTGGAPSFAPKLREQLKATRARHPDRLYVLSVVASPEQIADYEEDGFAVFEDPSRAVAAIHAMGRFGKAFVGRAALAPPVVPTITWPEASPSEAEAKRALSAAGIACVPEQACINPDQPVAAAEALGYPVVLKILSPDIQERNRGRDSRRAQLRRSAVRLRGSPR